jgi:hypothetical protein
MVQVGRKMQGSRINVATTINTRLRCDRLPWKKDVI